MSMSTKKKILSIDEMRDLLAYAVDKAGTKTACAKNIGVSSHYIRDCLRGRRRVGKSIAKAFGYKPVVIYVPLEDGD